MYPTFKNKVEWNEFFDEIRAQGISVIDDLFQVELMRPVILKKIAKTFEITSLTFTEDENCYVSLLSVAPHRGYKYLNIQENVNVLTTEGWARPVQFYCEDILNVEVEGVIALENLNHVIYKVGSGIDTHFVVKSNDGLYYDVVTKEEFPAYSDSGCPGIWDKESRKLKDNVIMYNEMRLGGHTCTNGQLKKKNITLVATNKKDFDSQKYFDCQEYWKAVTYDCVKYLCDNKPATPKDIAQANARLSAFKAPSCPIDKVKTFTVFMGKCTFQMKKKGDEYRDGWGFLASEYLGEAFTNLEPEKYFFAPWSADGLMVQCRPWMNKIMAETVARAYITEFKAHTGIREYILHRGHISIEDRDNFILGIKSKGKEGKFAGCWVTITDDPSQAWKTDLLTDLNGLKAPYDPDLESYLEILTLSHEEHDVEHGSRTSTQLIQSLMIADPERTMDVLHELAEGLIESKKSVLTADVGHAPSWMDFQGSVDYQQVIGRVVPQFAHKVYAPLWHSLVDNAIKGYTKAIRRLNLPTSGAHTFVAADSASDFGERILGVNKAGEIEVVCPIGEKYGYKRVVAVKYPKQHYAEYLKGRIVTLEEYRRRVMENPNLTDLQKRLIIKHVQNLSKGAIMIPAIETLKNQLAGMDFDGDAVSLFFDTRIVDIMWTLSPKAVVIDENDVTVHDVLEETLGV